MLGSLSMSSIWCWLNANASQIQAIAGGAAVIVACFVGWVAWKQKAAAEAQASAAKEQTSAARDQASAAREQVAAAKEQVEASREQVSAAREQVVAAKQQTETALLIADRETSPHISITQAVSRDGIIQRGSL